MSRDDEKELSSVIEAGPHSVNLLKKDNELFNEEDYIVNTVVHARRISLKKGEDWEILENNRVVLVMKGTRFTNSEKEFLRSVEGMKFLINEYKSGNKSVVKIKNNLENFNKNNLKSTKLKVKKSNKRTKKK